MDVLSRFPEQEHASPIEAVRDPTLIVAIPTTPFRASRRTTRKCSFDLSPISGRSNTTSLG